MRIIKNYMVTITLYYMKEMLKENLSQWGHMPLAQIKFMMTRYLGSNKFVTVI